MLDKVYAVVVDSRNGSPSQIESYKEHTCTLAFFDKHLLSNPKVRCFKSKVAELCGLDMEIYYHKGTHEQDKVRQEVKPKNVAASLLTFDPRAGVPEYDIRGKAYVIVNNGKYKLSRRQVWGIQQIASDASAAYHGDIQQQHNGLRDILRWCKQYREQKWGPRIAYKQRSEKCRDWGNDIESDWSDPWEMRSWECKGGSHDSSIYSETGCQHCHHEECTCRRCHKDNKEPCAHCQSRSFQILSSFAVPSDQQQAVLKTRSMPSVRSASFDSRDGEGGDELNDDDDERYFVDDIILNDSFRVIDYLPKFFFSCT